ncbi:hypothetical protein RD055328_08710 [Companilactobacillus sp. RD055328]|uniref:hypothetical protein n=1 Tax=Companilactobacillus sp. RD055328 TaxID=2916634 RepID=UPI001FC8B7EA|nr:hypothetical protein [Companilactobacillus sp. RD055328]GKQ42948.1 hypothetical protein RD055328_08710 [Companilactobacillus sp. RD055328]
MPVITNDRFEELSVLSNEIVKIMLTSKIKFSEVSTVSEMVEDKIFDLEAKPRSSDE